MRRIWVIYRRMFYPNGPWWFKFRVPSINRIIVFSGCTYEYAVEQRAVIDRGRLERWLNGDR
jgi:hypothetical protein